MRTLFRICLTASAMAIAVPLAAQAQSFDGNYAGVSIQGSGAGKSCTPSSPTPRPLTISGGNAKTVMGAQGDLVFQGTVNAQGALTMHSGSGAPLTGKVDAGGTITATTANSVCNYTMTWRKQ